MSLILPRRFKAQPQGAVELALRYKDALFFSMLRTLTDPDIARKNALSANGGVSPTQSVRPWGRTLTFNGAGQNLKTASGLGAPAAFTILAWVCPSTTGLSYPYIAATDYSVGFYFGGNSAGTQYEFATAADLGTCVGGTLVASRRDLVIATFASNLRSLYVNGALVDTATSSGINSSYGHLPLVIGANSGNTNSNGWQGDIDTLGVWPRAFSAAEVRSIYENPWRILKPRSRKLQTVSAAGTTHDLTGANSAQSNLAGSGIISQAHILSVQTSAQANSASAAAITQHHVLAADASVQTNAAASGAIIQSHDLTGTASGQANASESGAITQAHMLSGLASTQANTGSVGGITQGTQFVADPATQSNIAGTGAITQTHALAGAHSTQANAGSGAAISQSHTLAAAASIQPNVASNGAISQGVVHDLAPSATNQTNASSAGAITQTHVLVSAPSIQDSIAAASAIVQAHVLAALSATQLNIASTGAIEQFSGIPPVDAPAGSGPRLRTPHGHRPSMSNTARPRQLR